MEPTSARARSCRGGSETRPYEDSPERLSEMSDTTATSSRPFFRADHVGSLLRPKALLEARAKFAKGEIAREQLRAAEDTAIGEAVRQQEAAGLPVVTDGEFRRAVWWGDFIFKLKGTALGG